MVRDRRHYHQGSHAVKKQYYIIIGGLLVYITLFRLILPLRFFTSQILLRVLYLIPIIYAGLSKGKKGGVLVIGHRIVAAPTPLFFRSGRPFALP